MLTKADKKNFNNNETFFINLNMKTMKKPIALLMMLLMVAGTAMSQKNFTGKITYKIDFDMKDLPEEARGMLPKTMTMFIGDDKVKTEMFTQMGTQGSVVDLTKKIQISLINMMGQKYAIRQSAEEIAQEAASEGEMDVTITDETMEIAGYTCRKAIVKGAKESDPVFTAWFTDVLTAPDNINFTNPIFKQIKGVMLKYDMEAGQGMKMTMTAIEVEKMKVKEKEFEIPEGYQETTQEEMMRNLGG
jgi:hypothetical protein